MPMIGMIALQHVLAVSQNIEEVINGKILSKSRNLRLQNEKEQTEFFL